MNQIRTLLIVFTLVVFYFACPSPVFAQQTTLTLGAPVSGSLSGTGDEKAYQVTVSAGLHLSVILDGVDNYDSYNLYIRYNAQPTTSIYDDKGDSPNADQAVEIPSTQAGTYYILVRSTSSGGSFTIVAHSSSTFPSLTVGSDRTGSLQDSNDIKYYQVSVTAGKHLFVLLDGADNYDNYDLYIKYGSLPSTGDYDNMGQLMNADQAVEIANTQDGLYYVMVRSTASGGNYTVVAHDNSTLPRLTAGSYRTGSLQDTNDVQFYQVSASAGDHLFVLLDGTDNYDNYDLYIKFGALPTTVDYDNKSTMPNADQAVEINSAQAGTYYILAQSTASGGNFSIVAHNSTTFPSLTAGSTKIASLQDTNDVKYYQVSVAAGKHLFVLLDGADNYDHYELFIRFGSLPNTVDYDMKGILPDADQAVEINATQAGTYYVLIRSTASGGNFSIATHDGSTFPTLNAGSARTGSLQDTNDIKFYQVSVEAGKHLFVLLDGADNYDHYDLFIRFGALPSTVDYAAKGILPDADQSVEAAGTQAGTYYVMLRSTASGGNYSITAHTANTFPTLTPGITKTASLQDTNDIKFYQIPAAAGDHLFAILDGADNYDNYDLYIRFNALPTTVDYIQMGILPDADQAVEVTGAQAGMYYVMVRSTASGGNFSIAAHTANTFPTLTWGAAKTGSLQDTNDVKFYQVKAPALEHLFVLLDGADNYDHYDLYIRSGSLPTTVDYLAKGVMPNADQAVEIANAAAGSYYVMIRSTTSGGNYTITAHNSKTFPTLAGGLTKTGSLQETYDIKFYQVKPEGGKRLMIILSGDAYYNQYQLYVRLNALPSTVDYDYLEALSSAYQVVKVDPTQSGTYYIMVRSNSGSGNYRIRAVYWVTFIPMLIK